MIDKILNKLGYIKKGSSLIIYQIKNDDGQFVNVDDISNLSEYRIITVNKDGVPSIKDIKDAEV